MKKTGVALRVHITPDEPFGYFHLQDDERWSSMKMAIVIMLLIVAILVVVLSDVGQASIGSAYPPDPGMLILIGSGVAGIGMWGRNKAKNNQ